MIGSSPKGVMRFFSCPALASKVLPCQAKRLISDAISWLYAVPEAIIAVPCASPLGISPAGLLVNRSSSWLPVIFNSCETSYAIRVCLLIFSRFTLVADNRLPGLLRNSPLLDTRSVPIDGQVRAGNFSQRHPFGIGEYNVRSLFPDHLDCVDNEKTPDSRKHPLVIH